MLPTEVDACRHWEDTDNYLNLDQLRDSKKKSRFLSRTWSVSSTELVELTRDRVCEEPWTPTFPLDPL